MDILGYVVQQRVVINLKSGTAVIGVVTAKKRTFCVVRDAAIVSVGAPSPVPADGEIVVDRNEIDYIQIAERR
ncbi:Ro-like RNA binding protein [Gordonia phage Faith5x5]|nr:Ro-like RNA binding protein [Gordonia phage Faith5x5]